MALGDSITAGMHNSFQLYFSLCSCFLIMIDSHPICYSPSLLFFCFITTVFLTSIYPFFIGFGLMGWKGGVEEFRGQSWAIGGDPNATTLFNFLKTYNSSLIGGSLGHHIVGMHSP